MLTLGLDRNCWVCVSLAELMTHLFCSCDGVIHWCKLLRQQSSQQPRSAHWPCQRYGTLISSIKYWVVHNWSFCINIKYIQICSFGYLANLANVDLNNINFVGATVTMSSEYGSGQYSGSKVVDGIYVPSPETSSIAHTLKETSPWIMIDLGQTRCVKGVKIWNRSAAGCEWTFIVRLINLVPRTLGVY